MPIFQVDIEKRLGSEFWTNRYIVEAPNIGEASQFGLNIVAVERTIHSTAVQFTKMRTSTTAVGDGIYNIAPLAGTGNRSVVGTQLLPLFNTLRVDISANTGRPSRKYYRGVLTENDISGDAVTESFTSFADALENLVGATPPAPRVVDPDGETLSTITVMPNVQMRQLRRSRRRRTNGGGIFQ